MTIFFRHTHCLETCLSPFHITHSLLNCRLSCLQQWLEIISKVPILVKSFVRFSSYGYVTTS